ncbi:MAG: hypothetical protein II119_02045 [Bacilli bacterium]|nr:hypothetical protein [Bacilli bacterium]
MIINICYLYYDLLNLYGEIGNIKALTKAFETQKLKVNVDRLSINDNIDFNKYDLIYIGCGTENNLLIALNDLLRYKNELKEYVESNKFIIATGNSIDLFGKKINDKKALEIFNYNTKFIDKRIVGDYIIDSDIIDSKIIGFQNRGSIIENNNISFIDKEIGVNYKNFYGTYLLGPILVRNPKLNKYIVTKIIKSKNSKFKLKKYDLKLDEAAYKSYFETYIN